MPFQVGARHVNNLIDLLQAVEEDRRLRDGTAMRFKHRYQHVFVIGAYRAPPAHIDLSEKFVEATGDLSFSLCSSSPFLFLCLALTQSTLQCSDSLCGLICDSC